MKRQEKYIQHLSSIVCLLGEGCSPHDVSCYSAGHKVNGSTIFFETHEVIDFVRSSQEFHYTGLQDDRIFLRCHQCLGQHDKISVSHAKTPRPGYGDVGYVCGVCYQENNLTEEERYS